MTEKRNIFDGIQGLMPVTVRDPIPANTLHDGVVVLTRPTQIVDPFDPCAFSEAFMGKSMATMTITIPFGALRYTTSGFLTSLEFSESEPIHSPEWESLIAPSSVTMTFHPSGQIILSPHSRGVRS